MIKILTRAKTALENLRRDQSGAALIEYALVVGLVAVVSIASLTALQGKVNTAYTTIGNKLSAIK
jgi:Flp pilus assembly pilin Flp